MVIEKDGELQDLSVPALKFTKGQIVCLQNLIPNTETEVSISDVFCH